MKVYVLNYGYDYEGEDTRGVYSTMDAARDAVGKCDLTYIDSVFIHEVDLDAPPSGDKITHEIK